MNASSIRGPETLDVALGELDPTTRNQWYAVAAVGDLPPGAALRTRLLGFAIEVVPDAARGATARIADPRFDAAPALATAIAFGYVWVTPGLPQRPLFDIPEAREADRRCIHAGTIGVHVSAPRAIENFLDMGHFPYVHGGILGQEPHTEVTEYQVELNEERDEILATQCRFYQPMGSTSARTGAIVDYVYRIPHPFCAMLYKSSPEDSARNNVVALFLQPVDHEHVRAHMFLAVLDFGSGNAAIRSFQLNIFGQDKPILENQYPKRLPLDPRAETPIRADKSAVAYRRWLSGKGVRYGVIPAAA